jgi:hypothetical protein
MEIRGAVIVPLCFKSIQRMKLRSLLLLTVTAVSFQASAQTWIADSVSVGAVPPGPPGPTTYFMDVYYSMKNGKVSQDSNFKWHLAFDMSLPSGPSSYAGIIANHVQGKVNIYSTHKGGADFATFSASDTTGLGAHPLYNADTNWHWGALNANRDLTNQFDYGWGIYNLTTHTVVGDSIFLVKVGTAAYKMMVTEYVGTPVNDVHYTFRIAQLDNTGDKTVNIYRNQGIDFTKKNFAYYNITDDAKMDHEPDNTTWDLVFTRYIEPIQAGPGPKQPYPVAGVLSNLKVKVAEAKNLSPDTVTYMNYPYTTYASEIGSDWKAFNMGTFMYDIDTLASYFVRSFNSQEYYQIKFTRFDGSATGKYVFAKRMIAATAVKDVVNNISTYALAPNPAVNQAHMVLDAKEAGDAQLIVTSFTGQVMQRNFVALNKGTNAFTINTSVLAPGTYMVTVTNGSWKIADKLVVQH